MKKNEIEAIIRQYLVDNKVKEALDAMLEYVKGRDRYMENDLLLQQATYTRNHRDNTSGLITRQEFMMALARLNYAITEMIDRLPAEGNAVSVQVAGANAGFSPSQKQKILFLTANPANSGRLRLDVELRQVKDQLAMSSSRDAFELVSEEAVRIPTITSAMQKNKPRIVHFSGHGTGEEGIVIEGDNGQAQLFPTDGLDRLFKLFKNEVKCVILNACYSQVQAQEISKHGIYVIGMNTAIGDNAAVSFAAGFYQSIGEGNDYPFAFQIAMVNISPYLNDANTPEIWFNGQKS